MHGSTSYAHRHNSDGSYDSICTKCYSTVATAESEGSLASSESAHICQPSALYLANQGSIPERTPMLLLRQVAGNNRVSDNEFRPAF